MNDKTPIRSENGYFIQIAGSNLNLFSFKTRKSQNIDGSGYNIFDGLVIVKVFKTKDGLVSYMTKNKIAIEKECSIIELPDHLYQSKNMEKKARFVYDGITVIIKNIDPSSPTVFINKPWHYLQQQIFDQLDDSKAFAKEQLEELCEPNSAKDFMKAIREEDEDDTSYNHARAIWEYELELIDAIKNNEPTAKWAAGLDALKAGANAEDYNY